jgi:hypothetical protein
MRNPSVIRTKAKVQSSSQELSWSFMFLVIVCACIVAAGFFFAARQHFEAMDFGMKNSKLRDQIRDLETEKRRLMLAREVAVSPLAIRKAARARGMREGVDVGPVMASVTKAEPSKQGAIVNVSAKQNEKASTTPAVVRTVLSTPIQERPNGETRGRVVEPTKNKTEVAALLKVR